MDAVNADFRKLGTDALQCYVGWLNAIKDGLSKEQFQSTKMYVSCDTNSRVLQHEESASGKPAKQINLSSFVFFLLPLMFFEDDNSAMSFNGEEFLVSQLSLIRSSSTVSLG
jgi:hypothetical protein